MKLMRIGVDLAKNVFQIHGVDCHELPVWRQRLPHDRWLQTVLEKIEPGCEIGMESCGGAHHWVRQLQARGFRVKLIAPQFVKPYVKSNKNDANDAEAICEAMSRPSMRFVAVKTIEQQRFRRLLDGLWGDLRALDERVCKFDGEITAIATSEPSAVRLQQLRGVGPMIATALVVALGDALQFANGRQFAASPLTPRQHSSSGKDRLLGISKRGDAYLRTLMVHGARSALHTAKSKEDRLSQWAVRLAERSHPNVAAIAQANKTARMAWAMLRHGTDYQPNQAAA